MPGDDASKARRTKADCAAAGARAFEAYKERLVSQYGSLSPLVDPPEYHFNVKLGTCLMKVGHRSFYAAPTDRATAETPNDLFNEVIDVYEKKTLVSGGHQNRPNAELPKLMGTDPLDFEDKARALMTE